MRLLIVSAYFDSHRGGIEIVAGRLAREFSRAGHAVTWLASNSGYAAASCDESIRCVPVAAFNGLEHTLGLPYPIAQPRALRAIHREVARADVVMLHDCLYPTNIAAFLAARWLGKPLVVTQHIGNVPYRNPLLRAAMKLLTRLVTRPMLAGADQVVFISNITARAFADLRYRRPPRLIFNGIDAEIFHPAASDGERAAARAQFGLTPGRPVALFVGRFVEKKGLHILQQAARIGSDMEWVFAGWGKLDPREWALPNVRVFSGLAGPSLARLYQAGDALVLPSTGEGFPLVIQEALACALPVVCGAETAQADDRLAGIVHPVAVEGRDLHAAATDVLQAVRAAVAGQRRERLVNLASLYSWEGAGRLYLDLMSAILAEPVATPASAAAMWQPEMER